MKDSRLGWVVQALAGPAAVFLLLGSSVALAVMPEVKTVPWVASNPLIPHDTWSGKSITLKGTADVQGANFQYTWDFGDGSAPAVGTVTNQYIIQATHAYTGNVGDIIAARLSVVDTNTGETASTQYLVQIQDQTLGVEVNVAIDEGLWYLHRTMSRGSIGGLPGGWWTNTGYGSISAVNCNALMVNGHVPTGFASNPYTETAERCMRRVLSLLTYQTLSTQSVGAPVNAVVDPDTNGNTIGIYYNQSPRNYQLGMFIDAIVSTGTPDAVADVGTTNITGRKYSDIVQDMVDWYAWSQGDRDSAGDYGGWNYDAQNNTSSSRTDGSANQWVAIGLIAAEREFGATVPAFVKQLNEAGSTAYLFDGTGYGYDRPGYYPWGRYAVTPSGMVQLDMLGIGRGDNRWDSPEAFLRSNYCNATGSAFSSIRDYYYGWFSFTKSMLLHDSNGDTVAEPLDCLGGDLDWYGAQSGVADNLCNGGTPAPCNGVARQLVMDQSAGGNWSGNYYTSTQNAHSTAWAIIMLNRTVFASGLPVAVAEAIPSPGVVGQTITLDGSNSFHQDATKNIDSWEWDLDNDGAFDDATGPVVTTTFGALGDYPVSLRVTDDSDPEASDEGTVIVRITTPPLAPTADADGPYVFCPQAIPWFLDGTGSVNPDEGQSEIGQPGDTIQEYAWELDSDGGFDDAFGSQPDVTGFFAALGIGDYLVQLRVTDTTATSFPSSNMGDLSDTDSAQVAVKGAADSACSCIDDLTARPKRGKVQLVWTYTGATSYNVYRGTTSGGPFSVIANTTSTYSTYLDANVTNGVTYYYVVREAALNGDELCQSNEASATPVVRTLTR